MRDRQRKKYQIPNNAYKAAKSVVADYERLCKSQKGILLRAAVECALQTVPKEYRKGVMGRLVRGERFPLDASLDTYYLWCSKFIREVAKQLDLV
jgi:hypothetical protein